METNAKNLKLERASFDGLTYAAYEFRRLLDLGTYGEEDFFRLKATGNGETRWVNVTPTQLQAIIAILNQ